MSIYTAPFGQTRALIRCDATDCTRNVEAISDGHCAAWDAVSHRARCAGWSAWSSRSLRHYCPEHGPKPGHKMRCVWGAAL